jgi:hypothetical protein
MIHRAKKLDKRYNGGGTFKYMVDLHKSTVPNHNHYSSQIRLHRIQEFVDIRIWCWETWGPSCEIASYIPLDRDYVWSWEQEHGHMRLYLKTDKELAWFQLKWS